MNKISFIIPVLNEQKTLSSNLPTLGVYTDSGHELIVVDGGSTDASVQVAQELGARVLFAGGGRAGQMNAGARAASGDILLFLHIDTLLPSRADQMIIQQLETGKAVWGRFDVRLSGKNPIFRLVAKLMNLRSRLTSVATGDQAIFTLSRAFQQVGGYQDIALMEDICLSKSLRSLSRPACIGNAALCSSRRWEKNGIVRTIVLMWGLRLAYFLGASPDKLAKYYS